MGAWGHNIYENDAAMDFADTINKYIRKTYAKNKDHCYVDDQLLLGVADMVIYMEKQSQTRFGDVFIQKLIKDIDKCFDKDEDGYDSFDNWNNPDDRRKLARKLRKQLRNL